MVHSGDFTLVEQCIGNLARIEILLEPLKPARHPEILAVTR